MIVIVSDFQFSIVLSPKQCVKDLILHVLGKLDIKSDYYKYCCIFTADQILPLTAPLYIFDQHAVLRFKLFDIQGAIAHNDFGLNMLIYAQTKQYIRSKYISLDSDILCQVVALYLCIDFGQYTSQFQFPLGDYIPSSILSVFRQSDVQKQIVTYYKQIPQMTKELYLQNFIQLIKQLNLTFVLFKGMENNSNVIFGFNKQKLLLLKQNESTLSDLNCFKINEENAVFKIGNETIIILCENIKLVKGLSEII
ncbi:FERM/acyl-CoA-binding_protein superfamily [Hexamita inflata]|uniref:FERM/acyl-CoA-binding protein superfamily n=1 Tax=Hexamita inflata TaxID=28002 RepID=A0AA86NY65_9EUKA|nr:FERM/acyl-CoA-binding protein superfamily [Hexamita inflata]